MSKVFKDINGDKLIVQVQDGRIVIDGMIFTTERAASIAYEIGALAIKESSKNWNGNSK